MNTHTVFIAVQGQGKDEALLAQLGEGARTVPQQGDWSMAMCDIPVQEIEMTARRISAQIALPTVFLFAAENQFLFFGAALMGFTVFRHAVGNVTEYGMKEQHVQSKVLQDVLKLTDTQAIRKLVRERDISKLLPSLCNILGIAMK